MFVGFRPEGTSKLTNISKEDLKVGATLAAAVHVFVCCHARCRGLIRIFHGARRERQLTPPPPHTPLSPAHKTPQVGDEKESSFKELKEKFTPLTKWWKDKLAEKVGHPGHRVGGGRGGRECGRGESVSSQAGGPAACDAVCVRGRTSSLPTL